jgi:hypothetical protein
MNTTSGKTATESEPRLAGDPERTKAEYEDLRQDMEDQRRADAKLGINVRLATVEIQMSRDGTRCSRYVWLNSRISRWGPKGEIVFPPELGAMVKEQLRLLLEQLEEEYPSPQELRPTAMSNGMFASSWRPLREP